MPSDKLEPRAAAKSLLLELSEYRDMPTRTLGEVRAQRATLEDIVMRHLEAARREALEAVSLAIADLQAEAWEYRQEAANVEQATAYLKAYDHVLNVLLALATPAAEEPTNDN